MSGSLRSTKLSQKLFCRALTAIALYMIDSGAVPLMGVCGAGIGDQGDQIAEITGITYRGADALISEHAADHKVSYPKIPENIMDVGGNKNAG